MATIDGQIVRAGKADFVMPAGVIQRVDETAVCVAVADQYVGCVIFADELWPEAPATMSKRHQLGIKHLMMISGDRKPIAEQIAGAVGIDEIHAECLSHDKIEVLKEVPADQRPVAMVGDGVNDAAILGYCGCRTDNGCERCYHR